MPQWTLLLGWLVLQLGMALSLQAVQRPHSYRAEAPVKLTCNASLAAGSTLRLTQKLDLSGKFPNSLNDPNPCAINGPADLSLPPATIVLPDTDCALFAQGLVTIRGHVRFVVGRKTQKFDCCGDGEGHGSILCSYSNLTFAEGSQVVVDITSRDVVVNPGGFWTGEYISVFGSINATLPYGAMTGVNGLLSSSGVRVGEHGAVISAGPAVARGAAIQGGDYGTVVNGTVECYSFNASDAGGCVAAGNYLTAGPKSKIVATDGYAFSAGVAISTSKMITQGVLVADSLTCAGAGALIAADSIILQSQAKIFGSNLTSLGGGGIASTNLTMMGQSTVAVDGNWGGDGGVVGCTLVELQDEAAISCTNSYADICGACISANMRLKDHATITVKNATAKAIGGALCGQYPGQSIDVTGNATITVDSSTTKSYGGAIFTHNMTLHDGSFSVVLNNTSADCGGAIVALGDNGLAGSGAVILDGSTGGHLRIENAAERNTTLGCLNVEANLRGSEAPDAPIVPQPCSGCTDKPSSACRCDATKPPSVFVECCDQR